MYIIPEPLEPEAADWVVPAAVPVDDVVPAAVLLDVDPVADDPEPPDDDIVASVSTNRSLPPDFDAVELVPEVEVLDVEPLPDVPV